MPAAMHASNRLRPRWRLGRFADSQQKCERRVPASPLWQHNGLPFPWPLSDWTHLIGRASLPTEKLEQVLYRKRPSISLNRGMEFPDAGHDLVTETNGSVEPLPDRPGPRAQFECRRDEFLPRDLTLLHAAGRYTM